MMIQLKKTSSSLTIFHAPTIAHLIPFIVSVSCYSFAKLGPNQSKCVHDVVAFLMKSISSEAMIGCSEYEPDTCDVA